MKLLTAVTLAALAAGCAVRQKGPLEDLLASPSACAPQPERTLSRQDALADLAAVERVLRRGYAGFDVLAAQGVDWERTLLSLRTTVAALPEPITRAALLETLAAGLSVAHDNHLSFHEVTPGGNRRRSTGGHESAYLAALTLEERDGALTVRTSGDPAIHEGDALLSCAEPLAGLLRRSVSARLLPVQVVVKLSPAPPAPLACRFRTSDGKELDHPLELRRPRLGPVEKGGEPFELIDGEVPRLRVRSLDEANLAALDALRSSAAPMRAARAFVLDVRGNEGGGDGSVREFFKRLTTGPLRGREIERVESEVTVQGTVNDLTCALEGESRPASREIMSRDRAAAQASLTGPPERKIVKLVPLVAEGVAPHPYSGALVVLVDSRCASSCEAFVRYARQLPGAVVVGENTAGAGVFGETHSYPLPSGLWMTAGSKHFHDPDPLRDVVEGRGHLPDLWLDSDNAAGLAESLARCLGTPACAARLDEKRAAVP